MRRLYYAMAALAVLVGMSSCEKGLVETGTGAAEIKATAVIAETKVSYSETETALAAAWEVGDRVFGYWTKDDARGTCAFVVKSIDAEGVAELALEDGSQAPADGSTVNLAYANGASLNAAFEIPVSFEGQEGALFGLKNHAFMAATAVVADGTLKFAFRQQTAVLKMLVPDLWPATVSVEGSKLCTSAKFAIVDGAWGLVPAEGGVISSIDADADGIFYICVPATAEPTDLVFTAVSGEDTFKGTVSAEKQIVAGKCYKVPTPEFVKVAVPDEFDAILEAAGKNPADYEKIVPETVWNSYYNSSDKTNHSKMATGSGSLLNKFACTYPYTRDLLPVGSYIVQKKGYVYRPEAWVNFGSVQSGRPGEVSSKDEATVTEVTEEWWGSYAFRAFNLHNGTANLTDEAVVEGVRKSLVLFVPKSEPRTPDTSALDAMLAGQGVDVSTYTKIVPPQNKYAYYNFTSGVAMTCAQNRSMASNLVQFATTPIYSKEDIPAGSIIAVKEGFQYRPDGLVSLDEKSTLTRPGIVTASITVVDETYWENYNYRAFNIQQSPAKALSYEEMMALDDVFAIYVPKGPAGMDAWKTDAAGSVTLGFGAGEASSDFLSYANGVLSWTENTTGAPRSASITLGDATIKVTQLEVKDFYGAATFTGDTRVAQNKGEIAQATASVAGTYGKATNKGQTKGYWYDSAWTAPGAAAGTKTDITVSASEDETYNLNVSGLYENLVMPAKVSIDYDARTIGYALHIGLTATQLTGGLFEGEYVMFATELKNSDWQLGYAHGGEFDYQGTVTLTEGGYSIVFAQAQTCTAYPKFNVVGIVLNRFVSATKTDATTLVRSVNSYWAKDQVNFSGSAYAWVTQGEFSISR